MSQPAWLARPVYGFAAPLIILVTLVTNTLVVVVLSHKNLRTPTNHILLAMAITELMTGLSSCPWFLYYYTFGGMYDDEKQGLSDFWCKVHPYFAVHLPTMNFLIILTYPLNFAIYFGMSSSFKLQFRQLFSKQILYIASPNLDECSPGRPRFSIQLVDINKLRRTSRMLRKPSEGVTRPSLSPMEPQADLG
ncbi:unnamed protein product [Caenorhabditis auriculariae]|uniref:G-protein coupled receptors family 1 profile domain-containing protein n=1 Tax=Caenorhabditis auriculariae TaxID=2777116 RepID=A0A8S1GW13_9PELO|nr:unnamed protein product [Caenorhabditis auriculariae]